MPVVISKIFKDQVGKVLLSFYFHFCITKLIKAHTITICFPPTINTDDYFQAYHLQSLQSRGETRLISWSRLFNKCVIGGHMLVPSMWVYVPNCGPYDLWSMSWNTSYISMQCQWSASLFLSTQTWYFQCLFSPQSSTFWVRSLSCAKQITMCLEK